MQAIWHFLPSSQPDHVQLTSSLWCRLGLLVHSLMGLSHYEVYCSLCYLLISLRACWQMYYFPLKKFSSTWCELKFLLTPLALHFIWLLVIERKLFIITPSHPDEVGFPCKSQNFFLLLPSGFSLAAVTSGVGSLEINIHFEWKVYTEFLSESAHK